MSTDRVPDDVPVADAVEQSREVIEADAVPGPVAGTPALETPAADWQEQSIDAGHDLDGHDDRY